MTPAKPSVMCGAWSGSEAARHTGRFPVISDCTKSTARRRPSSFRSRMPASII